MYKLLAAWIGLSFLAPAAVAQATESLPVRKVVLFKNGIGYFQHQGSAPGSQTVEIPLSSSQLDDVLKSLTVLDLGGGRVSSVTYDSEASLDRQMGELPIDPRSAAGIVQFLNQVRGAEIEVDTPSGAVSGRLLSAELRMVRGPGDSANQVAEVSIVGADGRIRLVRLETASGFRFSDSRLTEDLLRSLTILAGAARGDVRRLGIHLAGQGERQLLVSYTAEAPIWKTTYRMVVEGGNALLQGWAIVDNTTPLAWDDVELSLVSGAPSSFIYRLSQPVYGDRPEVDIAQGPQVRPEVHDSATEYRAAAPAGVPEKVQEQRVQLRSLFSESGSVSGSVTDSMEEVMRRSMGDAAETLSRAEQFEYRIPHRVSIDRNQSALIPILQQDVKAEKVTLYTRGRSPELPRLAVWLTNETGMTLDGGSFTVIDSDVYAGEGLVETIQPGEKRLLSYAVDLAVDVGTRQGTESRRVEQISASQGVLKFVRKHVETTTYTIRNGSIQGRTVLLEHPVQPGWSLIGENRPVETNDDFYRFRVAVDPQKTATYVVEAEFPEETVHRISELSPEQIELWVRDRSLPASAREALQNVAERRRRLADLTQQLNLLSGEEQQIFQDQERIRGNLEGLRATAEESRLRQRYIDQLETQENRLQEIRQERDSLQQQADRLRSELNQMIANLSF